MFAKELSFVFARRGVFFFSTTFVVDFVQRHDRIGDQCEVYVRIRHRENYKGRRDFLMRRHHRTILRKFHVLITNRMRAMGFYGHRRRDHCCATVLHHRRSGSSPHRNGQCIDKCRRIGLQRGCTWVRIPANCDTAPDSRDIRDSSSALASDGRNTDGLTSLVFMCIVCCSGDSLMSVEINK